MIIVFSITLLPDPVDPAMRTARPELAAAIVDVVLAHDRVLGELQDTRDRVAQGRPTPSRGGDGPGRVGGDELDVDPLNGLAGPCRPAAWVWMVTGVPPVATCASRPY